MESYWRDREIVVDGIDNDTEWESARYFFDEKQVTVGIMNDADYLYVRLSSRDTSVQRQILMGGLTVWLAADGSKEKKFGLRYPRGMQGTMQAAAMPDMRAGGRHPGAVDSPDESAAMVRRMLSLAGEEMEIIGPIENRQARIDRSGARELGIDYAIADSNGNLVYELKIPLRRSEQFPLGISMRDDITAIGIGYVTEQISMNMAGRGGAARGGAGARGGGGDGMVGGSSGAGGGTRGGRGGNGVPGTVQSQPLEVWMKAYLADPK